jgi:predicted permease
MIVALNLSSTLVSFLSTERSRVFVDVSMDWRMLSFTAAAAGLTCILFGLAPALRASRTPPSAAMNASGRGITASRERFGIRRMLVVVQVALSLVLLVGSFLFARTLRNLNTVEAGFRRQGILTVDVDFSRMNVPTERRLAVQRDLLERVRAIPGVTAAAATGIVPVSGNGWNEVVEHGDNKTPTEMTSVTPEYFKTLGISVLAGRVFDERDNLNAPRVAIVNQKFAETFMGGGNPVGKTFRLVDVPGEDPRVFEIVGLVGNTKYRDLREDFPPVTYVPEAQDKQPDAYVALMIHSELPLSTLRDGVKRSAADISPLIGLDFRVFDTQLREGLLRERLLATLSGFFGALAAVLAMVGLYGVIAYMVIRRTNEIGIRMALGADRRAILFMIMREAGQMVGAALAIGLGLTLLASRAVSSLLYGLTPRDPMSLMGAAAAVVGVAVIATLVPAQRAADLDPMVALRQE